MTSFFITIDTNLLMFAKHIADRVTQFSIDHVKSSESEIDGGSRSVDTATDDAYKSKDKVNGNGNGGGVVCSSQPKTIFTLKSVWQRDINNTCTRIRMPYNYSDIILYDTPISYKRVNDGDDDGKSNMKNTNNDFTNDDTLKALQKLESCSRRNRVSFIFIDATYNYDFICENLKLLHGKRCVVIVNKHQRRATTKSLDLVADYLILMRENNVDDIYISKFIAFLIKSYQKFGEVIDVSLGKNTKVPMKIGTTVYCNIYDFITVPSNYCSGSLNYDCVQRKYFV